MRTTITVMGMAAAAMTLVAGCAGGGDARGGSQSGASAGARAGNIVLRGTASYRLRIALPRDAVLIVQVLDASDPGESTVIAETRVRAGGRQVPLPFELTIPASRIDPDRRYEATCLIESEGRTTWFSDSVTPVLTGGAPSVVDFSLAMAPPPRDDAPGAR